MNVSLNELDDFAELFWRAVGDAKVFALFGEMGAGKTTLVSALCKAKGVGDIVSSPTFSIINEYQYWEQEDQKKIYHIDLYRLKDEEEIIQAGVEDCIYSNHFCFVEWPQKAPHLFDSNKVDVYIQAINENVRSIKVDLPANSMAEQS